MKKTVLITGAASGVGKASTEEFARRGYQVFAIYRKPDDRAPLERIEGVHPIRMDVASPDDIEDAYREVAGIVGDSGLYAIINNAGITYTAPFEFAEERRAREVMDVNVMAPYRITKRFLPLLKQYRRGNAAAARVINIASWAGQLGQPFIPFYNASKAAVMALSESMYYDLGLLGIHVVLASPGVTKTPLLEKATSDGVESLNGMPGEGREFYRPYFQHYATMSERSYNSRFLPGPESAALKLFRIAEARRPRFKYNLAIDAIIVDNILSRFVPFRWRAALVRRMFRLNGG